MPKSKNLRRLAQISCLIGVFAVGSGVVFSQDSERKLLKKVEPEYPQIMRDKGLGGKVRLRVTVRPDGTVKDAIQLGGNPVLVESALRAVKQWRYVASEHESIIEVTLDFEPHPHP